jgi:hypothetical protein
VEWTGFIHLLVWRLLYWELEDDELSPVKTRKITRTTGTMIFWFLQLPQGRVHTRVCHSWSEESPEGTCPTICDLGRCPNQKVLQEVLALPSNIGRRSAHCLNKLIQMGAEDTRQQPNACQENHEARPPIKSKGVKRCQKCPLFWWNFLSKYYIM